MRAYPVNSPQAAARIVALSTVADTHGPGRDVDLVRSLRLVERLGLDGPAWHEVLVGVCQDLMLSAQAHGVEALQLDAPDLELLLAEVQDPALQHQVLELCLALAEGERPMGDAESQMLSTAAGQWGLVDALPQVPAARLPLR